MHKICHGDWFGGKGIGLCRFKIKGFNIDVYAAHVRKEVINRFVSCLNTKKYS